MNIDRRSPSSGLSSQLSTMPPAALLLLVGVGCFAAVSAGLVSQYQFGMLPCPWCTLQRLIFLVIGSLALLAAIWPGGRRWLAALGSLLSAGGVAAALWQHFVAAASSSCNLTLADRIMDSLGLFDLAPSVFEPQASCADAAVNLLGIPYAFWSLGLFLLFGGLCSRVFFKPKAN